MLERKEAYDVEALDEHEDAKNIFKGDVMSKTLTRRHEHTMSHEIPFRGHVRQRREKEFRATFSKEVDLL